MRYNKYLTQVDAHIGTNVEQASWLRLSVPALNTIVKNRREIERSFVQCALFSKQQKSLKCLPTDELESAIAAVFKQTRQSNASIDCTHSEEAGLHISARL
jgi:hypothetical protein